MNWLIQHCTGMKQGGGKQMASRPYFWSPETARRAISENCNNTGRKINNTGRTSSFWPYGQNIHSWVVKLHTLLDYDIINSPTKPH